MFKPLRNVRNRLEQLEQMQHAAEQATITIKSDSTGPHIVDVFASIGNEGRSDLQAAIIEVLGAHDIKAELLRYLKTEIDGLKPLAKAEAEAELKSLNV